MHELHLNPVLLLVTAAALAAPAGAGCGTLTASEPGPDTNPIPPAQITPVASRPAPEPAPVEPPPPPTLEETLRRETLACTDPVPVFEGGRRIGRVCPEKAAEHGLTVIDLSDSWAPIIFSEAPELGKAGHQPYRETYVQLADERFEEAGVSSHSEQYLELYGIFPTFRVLRERLGEEDRHACHGRVDDAALESLTHTIRPSFRQGRSFKQQIRHVRYLKVRLERAVEGRGLASIGELASDPELGPLLERYRRDSVFIDGVSAMQAHLACDGFLGGRVTEGLFDGPTLFALRRYQRRHMIVSREELDEDTRAVLALDSREADFRAVLRALRERVVDATGLVEDGSAGQDWGTVLDRQLNTAAFHFDTGHGRASVPASDAVSAATEAAARALGWTSAVATLEFLDGLGADGTTAFRAAVPLPPVPSYHSEHMDLRAELDRGDVYYELGNSGRHVDRRPVLTLFARDGDREVALVRWPTTIGGWQPENTEDGGVGMRYKNSSVGPRIWRDVVASPAWLPPESTPNEELLARSGEGLAVQRALMGPGYRSAYGLVMMMHHEVLSTAPDGTLRVRDEGIRSHGSVSYRSILGGYSHGCHRLFNHLAVRLASFLIHHRRHVRRGSQPVDFGREFEHEGEEYSFHISSRGYLYELTPPVPIEVLEGNVLGPVTEPIRSFRNVRYPEEPGTEGASTGEGAALPGD
jgi:hypothetical protein